MVSKVYSNESHSGMMMWMIIVILAVGQVWDLQVEHELEQMPARVLEQRRQ
jgi:hypothetical protein